MLTSDMLGERYHRCNPILPRRIDLDDASAADELKALAQKVDLLPTMDFLYRHWFPHLPRMLPTNVEVHIE